MFSTIFDNMSPRLYNYNINTPLCARSESYGERIVQHYEIELITSGCSGYIIVNGIPIPTITDTVNFRFPGMRVEGIGIYRCCYITFDLNAQSQVFGELENFPIVYRHIDTAFLKKFFDWIINCGSLPAYSRSLLFKSYIFDLFDKMVYESDTYSDHIYNPIRWVSKSIQQAIDYIQANYFTAIRMKDLANKVGYSVYHFSRTFKQMTGWTPTQYLTQYRINKAKQLMLFTNKSLETVSLECGFNSYSYFFRRFKSIYGMSPHEYKIHLLCNKP